jgi:hypothetical protein
MNEEIPPHFGYAQIGKFIGDDTSDQVMHIIFQLSAELWTVKRRLSEFEALLVSKGVTASLDSTARDESFRFDPIERDLFIERIFGGLREAKTSRS